MQHQNSVQNVYPTHRPTNGRLATATEAAVAWSKANRLRAAVCVAARLPVRLAVRLGSLLLAAYSSAQLSAEI